MASGKSNKKLWMGIIKWLIAVLSVVLISRQVVLRENLSETFGRYRYIVESGEGIFIMILLVLMMLLNWTLEAVKWKMLLNPFHKISFARGLRAVFSGITISFFTPNRIGEYAGRVLYIESNFRIKSVIATVIGSINQLLITILAGSLAFIFSMQQFFALSPWLHFTTVFSVVAICIAFCFLYFHIARVYDLLHRWKFMQRAEEYIRVFSYYHRHELSSITIYSMMRYLVFTSQYVLLLHLFDVSMSVHDAYRLVALVFLANAVVPTFAITELTVRGSIALYFMLPFCQDSVGILAASFSLWFLNLVIPALAGTLLILISRIPES